MSLYRKYRPQKFADVIGEDHVRDTLLLALRESRISHGYLFSGPRGIGKTSVARLLAKAVNCKNREKLNKEGSGEPCDECESCKEIASGKSLDVIEIDAASNRGIDEIRELRDKVKFSPTGGKYKVFIIDEVHMLTLPAFNALLKTLEEPPAHAIFILATTEAHKIPATILSRVQRFDFRRIRKSDIISNLKRIVKSEKLKADADVLDAIAVIADGSHRDSISLLEQIASISGEIKLTDVESVFGLARFEEIIKLLDSIAGHKSSEALEMIASFSDSGTEASEIIRQVIEVLRQLLLLKISGGQALFDQTEDRELKLKDLANKFAADKINKILSKFIEAGQLLKDSPIKTLPIEIAIIESCGPEVSGEKTEVSKEKDKVEVKKDDPKPEEVKIEKSEIEQPGNSTIEQLSTDTWKQILEKIKEENHTLNALLRDATPEGISGDEVVIAVKFKFHHDKISENQNKAIIEKVIEGVLGKKYIVKCQIKEKKPVANSQKLEANKETDLEAAAKEIFEVE